MHHTALRSAAAIVTMLFLVACSEPVTEPVTETGTGVEAPVVDAESPGALPQVIYYTISDS